LLGVGEALYEDEALGHGLGPWCRSCPLWCPVDRCPPKWAYAGDAPTARVSAPARPAASRPTRNRRGTLRNRALLVLAASPAASRTGGAPPDGASSGPNSIGSP
jgi:hypothetical protein